MKKTILVLIILFFAFGTTNAQFQNGKSHAGPSIGLSFTGNTISLGANYEYGMKMGDLPGLIGLGGIFRYWNYGTEYWSYTYIIIGAQGNYHFKVGNGKIDPYLGLTLAYNAGSSSWSGNGFNYGISSGFSGGIWFGFQAGARYWFSPNMAVNARFGAGSGSGLDVGIDFKF